MIDPVTLHRRARRVLPEKIGTDAVIVEAAFENAPELPLIAVGVDARQAAEVVVPDDEDVVRVDLELLDADIAYPKIGAPYRRFLDRRT